MNLKIKRESFEKYLQLRRVRVPQIAKELGYTPQYIYMILNHKKPASSAFVAKLLATSGLPFEYFFTLNVTQNYQIEHKCNPTYNNRKEGAKCGQENGRGKLDCGGNTRVAGETVPTQDTHGDVRLQAASQPSVQAPKVSGKSAGAEPATTTI